MAFVATTAVCLGAGSLYVHGADRFTVKAAVVKGGDINLGRQAIIDYGCGGCHVIPGVPNAKGRVGPRLNDFAEQIYIGGVLANTPQNLIAWIQDPRAASPPTAMPDLGVTEEDARNIAAYIYRAD